MNIPLEDSYADILGKGRRGNGLTLEELAAAASLSVPAVESILEGTFEEQGARALAKAVGLDPDRLIAIAKQEYKPAAVEAIDGLEQYNTAFEDMTVNSYLAWDPASKKAVAFDTGSDCSGALDTAARLGLSIELILLTHAHGDHIYDIDRLVSKTGAAAWISEDEAVDGVQTFSPGKNFGVGSLRIESRSTWGHSPGGVTFVVYGLARPVAVVGDAVFAGSMGGGNVSYKDALATNRANILSLPDETILCPGHGPMTTVGEQKQHNPFFP
jgi:hydroxyacylglutathione hydrolase